jgi:2-polyprenyl-6-methoxyphenol hydroxylase-like FAD-dependent oxidoreductase
VIGVREADVIVVGGGIGGLTAAMLLARDGHRVRLLERDPTPPPGDPADCWRDWERRGVNQFRMLHLFLPRWRQTVEAELPELPAALEAAGTLRFNTVADVPAEISGGLRPGDERFEMITGRRPIVEAVLARAAADTPGLDIERGVAVAGLLMADRPPLPGIPHVTGVETGDGRLLHADLVVDASGRRSPLARWLAALGGPPPVEETEACGWVYYGRHFRSSDGSVPPAFGPPLQPYDSISLLTLAADNGTWGVGIVTSAADPLMRAARHEDTWTRIIKHYPLVAHWLEGQPLSDGVDVMAKLEDRHRRLWRDGEPTVTGLVALGDAWACTNPSAGRGASIAGLHAVCLRDVLREVPAADPLALARRFDQATLDTVEPLYRDTLRSDRHRLAEIDAQIAGRPYETDDPEWHQLEALRQGAPQHPDLLRAYISIRSLLDRPVDVWAQPGIAEVATALGAPPAAPGPSRSELVALIGA